MGTLITAVTDGQKKQVKRFAEDAVDRAIAEGVLNKDGAQKLIMNGDEFQARIITDIRELSVSNQFADEEVRSSYSYLSGYKKPVPLEGQIDILRSYWPKLNPDPAIRYMSEMYPKLQLPGWIEGPFALIRPGFFSDIYGEELEEVLEALAKARGGKFYNYRQGQLGPKYLRQSSATVAMQKCIVEQQPGSDILIVPEQFGIRHRGRSVRRAREVFVASEFGEGAKNVGTMLITNPIRLQHYDDLWIDCAGDEYAPGADGDFSYAPCFYFSVGQVRFVTHWFVSASDDYGSASGFLPQ
ncbi:MAG: hypothetical protein WC514_02220 [Candidatus Paceibacterota bacterium]